MKKLTILTTILITANLLIAQIINIPQDYPTIQQGIDAANEGDTVLVQPGTYVENLIILEEITLASLYLTTQDTTYISQTIIDGNADDIVIRFGVWNGWWYAGVDSTCLVFGFTITNGYSGVYDESGAGIICINSSPVLQGLKIKNNHSMYAGGGIGCEGYSGSDSRPLIIDVEISNNTANEMGGGICGGNPRLYNVSFYNNSCTGLNGRGGAVACGKAEFTNVKIINCQSAMGGAFFCYGDTVLLNNVFISQNSRDAMILGYINYYGNNCIAYLQNVVIENNAGYGIRSFNSSLFLSDVTIKNNMGGLHILNSINGEVNFDTINRSSVYNNFSSYNYEIFSDSFIDVILDTFTVAIPTAFHVNQLNGFSYDILHGYYDQVDSDVYVSPDGDNLNSGLNSDEPLKTIICAQARLMNPHTIHLSEGTYSFISNGEFFPIQLMNNISLAGVSAVDVVLDGSGNTVLQLTNSSFNKVSGLTLCNGEFGIFMKYANPLIENVEIRNNNSQDDGGGIYIFNSSPTIINSIIIENSAHRGSGIYCFNSQLMILNSTILNNIAGIVGGGLYCGGGSSVSLINSIVWENIPEQLIIQGVYTSNSATISYSDIQDGQEGIAISGTGTLNWLEGNMAEDPLFENSGDHPFQLSASSPCIDSGTPDTTGLNLPYTDLLGNIRIWDGNGIGSAIVDMGAYEFGSITGLQTQVQSSKFKVRSYPNPVSNDLTLEFELAKPARVSIQIYNNIGELLIEPKDQIYSTGKHQVNLYLADLNEGIYFCRVQIGNEMVSLKIIKL